MPGLTWDDVVALAAALPQVEVGPSYGTPALRVRRALMCRLREEDGETLAIRCDLEERPFLIDAQSGVLFVPPRYQDSPMVPVALPRAHEGLVRESLEDACAERAPKSLVTGWRAGHGIGG